MTFKITRFIAFFVASVFVLKEVFHTVMSNYVYDNPFTIETPDSIQYAGIALLLVGLSIFLKREIWAYLFFLLIVASFFPLVSFTSFGISFYIGSLELEIIPISLLITHVLLNVHLIRKPVLSEKQLKESNNEKVEFFMKSLEKKSTEELEQMDASDLVPEAIEARRVLLEKRSM